MITYRFISQTFLGEPIKVQYSKFSSTIRIDLGSGTFPFEYTTDQKGGTYYFYINKLDTTFTKTIDIPPVDFVVNVMNVPDCDISGIINEVPSCDIIPTIIEIPVCDVDYNVIIASPTPTPTTSVVCPIITGVTVGPIEISGGDYTLADNTSTMYLYQFNSSGQYICDIPSQSNSILPDSLFQDEITVLVPSPYWLDGPCQYCFNINTGEQFECNQVIPTQLPTPSTTQTPTITPTPEISVSPTPTITPTPEISVSPTPTITPTPEISVSPTPTITPTPEISPTITSTPEISPTITSTVTPTISITPSITPTQTPTPTATLITCPEIVGGFSTDPTNGVYRFISPNNGFIYFVNSAETLVYNESYNYVESLPNDLSSKATSTFAAVGYVDDGTNTYLFVGSGPDSNSNLSITELKTKTKSQITNFGNVFEMSVNDSNTVVGTLTSDGNYQQVEVSTENTLSIPGVTTLGGDITWSNIDSMFYVVSTGDTLYRIVPDTTTPYINDSIVIGDLGLTKTLLYDRNTLNMYLLTNDNLYIYDRITLINTIDLTTYAKEEKRRMTIDTGNNKLYILVITTPKYSLIRIDISSQTIDGIYALNNAVSTGFDSGEIIYNVTNKEILQSFKAIDGSYDRGVSIICVTPEISVSPTPTVTNTLTSTITPTPTVTNTITPSSTPIVCNCINMSGSTPGDGVFLITLSGDTGTPKDYDGFTPITNTQIKVQFYLSQWSATLNGNMYGNILASTALCPISNKNSNWVSTAQLTIFSTTAIVCP